MAETGTEGQSVGPSVLAAVSSAMVALHKEQFGRGPTKARTDFAGPDAMMCVLEDVLLPAELSSWCHGTTGPGTRFENRFPGGNR